jgi:hypothetical protein
MKHMLMVIGLFVLTVTLSGGTGCLELQAVIAPASADDDAGVTPPPTNEDSGPSEEPYGPFPPSGDNDANTNGADDPSDDTPGDDDPGDDDPGNDDTGDDTPPDDGEPTLPALEPDQVPEMLPSGLQVFDFEIGDGASPESLTDAVRVDYAGYIQETGRQFDSGENTRFTLNGVIAGFGEGILGMNVGGRRRIIIPPDLGYGEAGNSRAGISGTDVIVFDVTLNSIE